MAIALTNLSTLICTFAIVLCQTVSGSYGKCSRSETRVLNGMETTPDRSTLMLASSHRDRHHTAFHGLAFGYNGWSPKVNQPGEWLEADLGSESYVSQVRVYLLTPGVKVRVTAGANGQSPSQVIQQSRLVKANFVPPVLTSHIRVTVTDFLSGIELEMMAVGCRRWKTVAEENLLHGIHNRANFRR